MCGNPHFITLPLSRTRIEYTVRRSRRASRMTLKVSPPGAVEIVIPYFTSSAEADAFLSKNLLWLERTLRKIAPAREKNGQETPDYPTHFSLRFSGEEFALAYEWKDVCWVGVRPEEDRLIVSGAVLHTELIHQALRDWLLRTAQMLLPPLMRETAEECGIVYQDLSFRIQQKRWGSCSGRGNISLNALLLFFPREYVRYVMIHELCHISELNHSAAFWRLVASHCRDYRFLRSALNRESTKSIPALFLSKG